MRAEPTIANTDGGYAFVQLRRAPAGQALAQSPHAIREVGLFAGVAVLCVSFDLIAPGNLGLSLAGITYLVWSLSLARWEACLSTLKLNPLVCYQLWQAVTLGIAPAYLALRYSADASLPLLHHAVPLADVSYGHAILIAGSCAFYAGMRRGRPAQLARFRPCPYTPSSGVLLLLLLLGVATFIWADAITPYLGSTVVQFRLLPIVVFSMIALNPPRALTGLPNAQLCVLLAGSLLLLGLSATRDSKMELMFSFFPLVWWMLWRRKRQTLAVGGLVLAWFYLVVVAPVVSVVRTRVPRDEAGRIAVLNLRFVDDVAAGLRENITSRPGEATLDSVDATMLRLCDSSAAGLVASLAESGGLLAGRSLYYVPVAFIPRAIWREKPSIEPGREFTAALGWVSDSSLAQTSTGETSAGELYWNFGWPGVLIGMYILGFLLSWLWWGAAGPDPRRGIIEMVAYVGATLTFVLGTGAAAGPLFVNCIANGLLWRTLIFLRNRMARRSLTSATHPLALYASNPLRAPAHAGRA